MNVQVVIPARLEATRLPGKPLLPIGGKPMLQHVWERARQAGMGPLPIVATDSERLADTARAFGAPVVMTSPDHCCGSERVAEVARDLGAEVVINLQADEVMIDPHLIAHLPGVFADPSVRMATVVARLPQDTSVGEPSLVKAVLDQQGDVLYFSRLPVPHGLDGNRPTPTFYGHVGVYAYRREFLLEVYTRPQSSLELAEGLEQLRVLQAGYRIRAVVWPAEHFGVNTPQDLESVREWLERPNG